MLNRLSSVFYFHIPDDSSCWLLRLIKFIFRQSCVASSSATIRLIIDLLKRSSSKKFFSFRRFIVLLQDALALKEERIRPRKFGDFHWSSMRTLYLNLRNRSPVAFDSNCTVSPDLAVLNLLQQLVTNVWLNLESKFWNPNTVHRTSKMDFIFNGDSSVYLILTRNSTTFKVVPCRGNNRPFLRD